MSETEFNRDDWARDAQLQYREELEREEICSIVPAAARRPIQTARPASIEEAA